MRSPTLLAAAASLAAGLLPVVGPAGTPVSAATSDLFVSEYVEGSSNNKAIEIFNGTGAPVDLGAGGYVLELYSNGASSPSQSLSLTGTVADGDVFVAAHPSADPAILAEADVTSGSVVNFNGDDAVVLRKAGVVVDAFGQVGTDPGSEWPGGGQNETLRRVSSVCAGDTDETDPFDASVEWTSSSQDDFSDLGAHTADCATTGGGADDLFFSEYVEGSSFNKAIEIFNGTGAAVDLAAGGYVLELYSNGASSPSQSLSLTGTVADGDVFVASHPSADPAILAEADVTSGSVVNFNGDDAVVLRKAGVVVDAFGQVGTDPGSQWPGGGADDTLRRTSSVCAGDTDETDPFDASVEWLSFPQNTFDGLGAHTADCATSGGDPLTIDCGLALLTDEGVATSTAITASDADDTVIAMTLVTDDVVPAGSLTPGFFAPSSGVGEPATLALDLSDAAQAGIYSATVEAQNASGETVTCDLEIRVQAPPGTATPIHDIQGSGSAVAITTPVTVEAVVTSLFERDDALDGFFMQEEDGDADADPATSEGIFVFCRGNCPAVQVGDLVSVDGTPTDFFGMSQIDMTSAVGGSASVVSSGNALPTATVLTLPASAGTDVESTYESVEGMIVRYSDTLVISEYFQLGRFGQVVLTDEARPFQFTQTNTPDVAGYAAFLADLATKRIILDDDNNDQNDAIFDGPDEAYPYPVPGLDVTNFFRGGDSITGLTGVMHWSFPGSGDNTWRLRPIQDASVSYDFTTENPRPAIDEIDGEFRVATLNVLNYFSTVDVTSSTSSGDCGPTGTADCRGADSENERVRQLDKIVAAMLEIDADVYGLVELENDGDDQALQDIVGALNAAQSSTTFDYVATGFIGGDAIKVGFVYDTSTAATVGSFAVLDSSVDPTFIDTKNRPALIQTFEETASGERLTLAVNHFKSKGSPCDDVGDPGLNDGTGNCNLTRTTAAQALAAYLATDPTGSSDPDVMILGDLNAYLAEDPIVALQTAGYTDLASTFIGPDAYSFVFDGQLGTLDYALANAPMLAQVRGVTEWHINADEINLLDYNDDVRDPGEASFERESSVGDLYDPDPFRSSDHDPVVVGLDLGPDGACPDVPNVTKIHEIQGDGAATPCDGEVVVVEGVVVGDYEGSSPELRGFYVQEEDTDVDADPATSEGVFVFNSDDDDVALGDQVRVTATAGEFQGQTQLGFVDEIVVLATDQGALVTPTEVSLPVATADAFEAVEGMSVAFAQELFVTEYFQLGRFGQVVVSSGDRLFNPTQVAEPGPDANAVQAANDLNRLIIDDTRNEQNPEPIIYGGNGAPLAADNPLRGGDVTVGATGVMTFTWAGNSASGNAYRLRPADASSTSDIVFETRNPRPEAKPDVGGSLEVASFNVLNYFLTIDDGSDVCGPIVAKDGCRGADSSEELERQRDKLLPALVELDADVIGLIELENTELADGTVVEPLADIVDGLNDLQGPGTWDYVDTGVIGTDVIKVGIIYRVDAVDPFGDFAVIDSTVDPRFDDDRNRPTLAQTFVESDSGEVMTVVVNHLKSKSCRDATGAELDQGDGQGCYNASRTAAAEAIVDWLAADPTGAGDTDVLVIGDLNAYANEDPIDVFAAAGYVDLSAAFAAPDEEPYSFVFSGQWGTLDYALASPSLVDQVIGADEYHINADEVPVLDYNTDFQSETQIEDLYAPDQFRTSDHDPILVGLELDAGPTNDLIVFPDRLWPANGRMRTVVAFAFDSGFRLAETEILEVTSSQADSGLSPRDRPNDIDIRSDRIVRLRAETFGSPPRTYELTIAVRGDGQLRVDTETVDVVRRFVWRWF